MTTDKLDQERDLAADLALCEAATPGYWYTNTIGREPMKVWYRIIGGPKLPVIADHISARADVEFIAAAREGWPIAIRRAMAAEAEVKYLMYICGESEQIADLDYSEATTENYKIYNRGQRAAYRHILLLLREMQELSSPRRLGTPEDLSTLDLLEPDPEAMHRLRESLANHVPSRRRLPDGTLERTREEIEEENANLRAALERIISATMSQYASTDDMLCDFRRIAKEVLVNE